MISPKTLADGLACEFTGRFFHEPTISYWYLFKGVKIGECALLEEISEDEQLVIDKEVWRKFFEGGMNGQG